MQILNKDLNVVLRKIANIINIDKSEIIRNDFDLKNIQSLLESENDLENILELVVKNSVNTSSPFFMNQLYGGTDIYGILGDFIVTALNTSMYTYEVAPVFSIIEKDTIKILADLVGFKNDFDGTFTSGGSISNLTALVLARDEKFPNFRKSGFKNTEKIKILVSEYSHYSFLKAVIILGFGSDNLVKVKTDSIGKMDIQELDKTVENILKNDEIPLMIVGTAGTTINGVFDDLESIHQIARNNNIWFHVDACYGGSLIFSEIHKKKLFGIEKANSVSWDLHKMAGMPLTCALFLTSKKDSLERSMSVSADYLFHQYDFDYDLGKKSLQCGRKSDSFKFWLSYKIQGLKYFKNRIDLIIENANYMADIIKGKECFKLFSPIETGVVCFSYKNDKFNDSQLKEIVIKTRELIFKQGKILFNYSNIKDQTVFRCVISNPEITKNEIKNIIHQIEYYLNQVTEISS